ncbi:hypothetical protein Patl1_04574 [Pistacia atlantica]|uniref:Uncharacterized protein n=1 Tax=Pistacia atlantica TaxID=434234 RepID=A0ACC1BTB7_9ROSI|nr:hypothetical protein Patl1_04574 [Pistacia atlantica]
MGRSTIGRLLVQHLSSTVINGACDGTRLSGTEQAILTNNGP